MSVLVYTACFGGYDKPRPQVEQSIPVDWLYVDGGDRGYRELVPEPWKVSKIRSEQGDPMMAAKWYKMHPPQADYAIWVDASMEVTSPTFVEEAVAALDGRPFAVWKHPRRDDVAAEVGASVYTEAADKYAPVADRMLDQSDAYYKLGLPIPSGLYACGTIVWTPEARKVGRVWWNECRRWTHQDQVSLPFVCWALGVRPATFPIPQIDRRYSVRGEPFLANEWLRIWPHRK